MNRIKEISEIFQNFLVGIGTFLAGCASIPVLNNWLKEKKLKKLIDGFRKEFPRELLNKNFRLIKSKSGPKIYIHKNNQKRWIKNSSTLRDLEFDFGEQIEIGDDELNSIMDGEAIITRDDLGT